MQPWETKYNLLAAKAAAAGQQQQAGWQNIFSGLQTGMTALGNKKNSDNPEPQTGKEPKKQN